MTQLIQAKHPCDHHAGKTLFWLSSDSESLWNQNMADPRRAIWLKELGFDTPDCITYQMNRHGFRTGEFDDQACFVALGCSFTAGIGLPEPYIWPSWVQQSTGLVGRNLGIAGSGLDTAFRLLLFYIDQLNVKAVLLLKPSVDRFEFHINDRPHLFHPHYQGTETIHKYWYADRQNSRINYHKNIAAIQGLCAQRNIKLIIKDVDQDLLIHRKPGPYPGARDLVHVGQHEQNMLAQEFVRELA